MPGRGDGPLDHSGLGRRRWLILGVIGLAQLMVVLDLTVMNIALPIGSAGAGFHHGRPAAGGHRSHWRQRGSR
jgi:hypothetical protein